MAMGVLALAGVALLALADTPNYKVKTATGSTAATVVWPADPLLQIRLVGTVATSDKAGAVLSFRTGVTPLSISVSNPAGTAITLTRTNGVTTNDIVVVQYKNGTAERNSVVSFQSATNVTLAGATSAATAIGDEVYVMSTPSTLPVGAATVSYQGEAIYVGNKGRPISCVLDGTSACTINAQTARYE